jgi:hypothetical protein
LRGNSFSLQNQMGIRAAYGQQEFIGVAERLEVQKHKEKS